VKHAPLQTESRHTILLTVAGLTFGFLIVEIVFGLITNSLALLADAVHMFTDSGALALSSFAAWMAQKPATPEKSYGYYRFEILAALANSVILMLSALYILYEAYQRFLAPREVIGLPMMTVAFLGLLVNLIGSGYF
jgi:cobalt-zinc-cadmium efflux system protein